MHAMQIRSYLPVKLDSHFLPVAVFLLFITLNQVKTTVATPTEPLELPKAEPFSFSSEETDDDDDYVSIMQKIIAGIVTFVIVVVIVCIVLCFCCPICIISKMRRRRGVVVRTGPGNQVTTNGNTITVTMNRSAAPAPVTTSPPVVAISNNMNSQNKPYPVQESVTVVPLLHPQIPAQYPSHPQPMNYHPGPAFPQFGELPPPYPGLSRDPETANLPYNPYFTSEQESPSAPPPK